MVKPKPLVDGIWLLGGGSDTDALTDPHDCHTYLVWDGHSGFLVDCGTGLGFQRWADAIAQVCDPGTLAGCLVTHYHADHCGGAARVRGLGLRVYGSAETANALAYADEERTQVRAAREASIYPSDYRLQAAEIQPVAGSLAYGAIVVEVVQTPGHCDGHVVFDVTIGRKRVLFSGDCLFAGGLVSLQAIPDCRLDRYAASVIELASRHVDVLLPGHGAVVLDGASQHIRRAAGSFQRLIPPPNLLTIGDPAGWASPRSRS